jgi:hypothetical protein
MAWGGHGFPKVSLGSAMPDPSTPCGWAIPETALWPFQGWPACKADGLRLSSTPMDTPRRTPLNLLRRADVCTMLGDLFNLAQN